MKKNILIGLSGGPSCVINSSLAGIIHKAAMSDSFDKIYGARHGIHGVLEDRLIDMTPYCTEENLTLLKQTPAMALGSCRRKLKAEEYPIIKQRFDRYGIGAFFYIGGNDSMDTVLKLSQYFKEGTPSIIGVPKTIDNDLPETDHSPGFGSAAKYLYHTVSEIIRDSVIYPVKNVVIIEVMGRNSGWLTLAAGLPAFLGKSAPQIIAIPETPFDEFGFITSLRKLLETQSTVVCVVSEGIRDKSGEYIGNETKSGMVDCFGHAYLSGVGKYLEYMVKEKIGCKVRSIELNVMQRCASHLASQTDVDEAFFAGEKAVDAAARGETGKTLVFRRISDAPYRINIESIGVEKIANLTRLVPEKWRNLNDKNVQKEICNYLLPLIQGDVNPIRDETGLPRYIDIR